VFTGRKVRVPPPEPTQNSPGAQTPPVGQALVPEGVFAVQLAQALKAGKVQEEAQAHRDFIRTLLPLAGSMEAEVTGKRSEFAGFLADSKSVRISINGGAGLRIPLRRWIINGS